MSAITLEFVATSEPEQLRTPPRRRSRIIEYTTPENQRIPHRTSPPGAPTKIVPSSNWRPKKCARVLNRCVVISQGADSDADTEVEDEVDEIVKTMGATSTKAWLGKDQ